jgi:hypothetical protein
MGPDHLVTRVDELRSEPSAESTLSPHNAAQRQATLESGHAGGVLGQGAALMLLIRRVRHALSDFRRLCDYFGGTVDGGLPQDQRI